MKRKTLADNLCVELFEKYPELIHDENDSFCGLTNWQIGGIVDLVLERTAEVFEAYSNGFQAGSAFRPFHIVEFLRGLKDDKDAFQTPAHSDNPGDLPA